MFHAKHSVNIVAKCNVVSLFITYTSQNKKSIELPINVNVITVCRLHVSITKSFGLTGWTILLKFYWTPTKDSQGEKLVLNALPKKDEMIVNTIMFTTKLCQ